MHFLSAALLFYVFSVCYQFHVVYSCVALKCHETIQCVYMQLCKWVTACFLQYCDFLKEYFHSLVNRFIHFLAISAEPSLSGHENTLFDILQNLIFFLVFMYTYWITEEDTYP